MAFAGIHIGYYDDASTLTQSQGLIYGNLVSSFEDATVATIETTVIPKTALYAVITVSADTWIEIDYGTPDAATGRRQIVKAGVPYPFAVGPMTAAAKSIGYLAA